MIFFVVSMTTGRVFQLKVICGGFGWFEAQHQPILGSKAIDDSAKITTHACAAKVAHCGRKWPLEIKPWLEILRKLRFVKPSNQTLVLSL